VGLPACRLPSLPQDVRIALLAHGKTPKQVQGWLRHSQITTTMNVYIHRVDDRLGGADAWDDILAVGGGQESNWAGIDSPR
jgi:integrase